MAAEVATKTDFSTLNAAIVMPLIAPPVPSNPAKKPDKLPPIKLFFLLASNFNSFLMIKRILNPIKKNANTSCRYFTLIYLLANAPMITKRTAGMPIWNKIFLSNPFLNKAILEILLNT